MCAWVAVSCWGESIVVLSDLHVVHPDSAAAMTMSAGQRKLLKRSAEIFTTVVDSLVASPAQMVLITGDLTESGDLASHNYVASQLARLQAVGTTVLVIPGNHDCGKEVSKEQFAQIYAPYGYTATTRDPGSLSYVVEPVKGIVVLGIDSNGESCGAALSWAAQQAQRNKGKTVLAMMHHHLVPHFDQEATVLATSVVDDSLKTADALMKAGVHYVFTGHTHIHDAAVGYNTYRTDSIIDICTGSLAGYPHPYRVLDYTNRKLITGRTLWASSERPPIQEQSRALLETSTPLAVQTLARKSWNKVMLKVQSMPMVQRMLVEELTRDKALALVDKHLTPSVTQMLIIASEGNENRRDNTALKKRLNDGLMAIIDEVVKREYREAAHELLGEVVATRLMPIVNSILDDTNPPSVTAVDDNNIVIRSTK